MKFVSTWINSKATVTTAATQDKDPAAAVPTPAAAATGIKVAAALLWPTIVRPR